MFLVCIFLICSSRSVPSVGDEDIVTEKDLEHLRNLLDGKVGDAMWQNLMERSTPTMTYQAWRHEPEVNFGHVFNSLPFLFLMQLKVIYLILCLCPSSI